MFEGVGSYFADRMSLTSREKKFMKRAEHQPQARENVIECVRDYINLAVFNPSAVTLDVVKSKVDYILSVAPKDDVRDINSRLHENRLWEKLEDTWSFHATFLAHCHDFAVLRLKDQSDGKLWKTVVEDAFALKDANTRAAARNKAAARLRYQAAMRELALPSLVAIFFLLAWMDGRRSFLPHDFYHLLRFSVCAIFGWWTWQAHKTGRDGWRIALGLNAALYNPFLPMPFERETWQWLNLATTVLMGSWMLNQKKFQNLRFAAGRFLHACGESVASSPMATFTLVIIVFMAGWISVAAWKENTPEGRRKAEQRRIEEERRKAEQADLLYAPARQAIEKYQFERDYQPLPPPTFQVPTPSYTPPYQESQK